LRLGPILKKILRKILRIILLYIIPEQFTVKAHPALVEGGRGGGREGANKLRNTFPEASA